MCRIAVQNARLRLQPISRSGNTAPDTGSSRSLQLGVRIKNVTNKATNIVLRDSDSLDDVSVYLTVENDHRVVFRHCREFQCECRIEPMLDDNLIEVHEGVYHWLGTFDLTVLDWYTTALLSIYFQPIGVL